jgi:hypothetical protein
VPGAVDGGVGTAREPCSVVLAAGAVAEVIARGGVAVALAAHCTHGVEHVADAALGHPLVKSGDRVAGVHVLPGGRTAAVGPAGVQRRLLNGAAQ